MTHRAGSPASSERPMNSSLLPRIPPGYQDCRLMCGAVVPRRAPGAIDRECHTAFTVPCTRRLIGKSSCQFSSSARDRLAWHNLRLVQSDRGGLLHFPSGLLVLCDQGRDKRAHCRAVDFPVGHTGQAVDLEEPPWPLVSRKMRRHCAQNVIR